MLPREDVNELEEYLKQALGETYSRDFEIRLYYATPHTDRDMSTIQLAIHYIANPECSRLLTEEYGQLLLHMYFVSNSLPMNSKWAMPPFARIGQGSYHSWTGRYCKEDVRGSAL